MAGLPGVARLWATPDGTPLQARDAWDHRGARAVYKRRRVCSCERRHKLRARGDIRSFRRGPPSGPSYKSTVHFGVRRRRLVLSRTLASTLSPRYRSLFGNQLPDVCEGDGFPIVAAAVTCWRGGTTPARTLSGAFLGGRRDYLRPGSTSPALVAYLNNTQHFASSLYQAASPARSL